MIELLIWKIVIEDLVYVCSILVLAVASVNVISPLESRMTRIVGVLEFQVILLYCWFIRRKVRA